MFHPWFFAPYDSSSMLYCIFSSTKSGKTLFVCCAASLRSCNKFNRPIQLVTFSFAGQKGATPLPAQLLHPSSHPTVLSHFRHVGQNHLHIPWQPVSGRFFFPALAEPEPLLLSVLPGPQWLGVLPSTLVSALAEEPPLQYSFATGHFHPDCARYQLSIHSTQHDASTYAHVGLNAAAGCSSTVFMAESACPSVTLVRLSVCARYLVVFPGFFLFNTVR